MKIGVVGAGQIVTEFLNASKLIEQIEIEAICAIDMDERLKELSEKYHIPKRFDDFDKMLKNIDADTMYIAVPNHLHFSMAEKSLLAKKNVILEKPFTITLQEANQLFEEAEKNQCFIFEAITTLHSPNYKKAREIVQQMSDIKIVYLNYTQYSSRYDAFKQNIIFPVFDYKKAGGALRDINIYNIHFIIGIFGKPKEVKYYPNIVHNIDVSGTLLLIYEKFVCVLIGAKDCLNNAEIRIQTDKKTLLSYSPANAFRDFMLIDNNETMRVNLLTVNERLYYELVEFECVVRENDIQAYTNYKQHTLEVMRVVEEAFKNK